MHRPSLRRLAPAALGLVAAVAAGAAPASELATPGEAILTRLFSHISPDDFDYDAGQRLAELEQALDGLRAAAARRTGPTACLRYCDERAPVLERSCDALLQPSAARPRALCFARVIEMTAQCRAGCGI